MNSLNALNSLTNQEYPRLVLSPGPHFVCNTHVNDIVARLSAHCLMFADDIKIFSEIRNVEDAVSLQKNLVLKLLKAGVWRTRLCVPVKSVLLLPSSDHCHRYLSLSSFSLNAW